MTNKEFEITIITVTFNAVDSIEKIILSVIAQDFRNKEYIIIDGGSTDGTLDIIKRYESHIDHWISEPDKGIYDAMNKGLSIANGEWISFMNAGDVFASSTVISNLFRAHTTKDTLCVYGNHTLKYNEKSETIVALPPRFMKKRIAFCHQASILRNMGFRFRTDLKICADYALFREIYEKYGNSAFCYWPIVVSINDAYGISSIQNRRRQEENISIIALYDKKRAVRENIKFFFAKLLGRI